MFCRSLRGIVFSGSRKSQNQPKYIKSYDVFVAVPNDRYSHSNSVEFTQSQQSVGGTRAPRTVVNDFIDGEYADGLDDES